MLSLQPQGELAVAPEEPWRGKSGARPAESPCLVAQWAPHHSVCPFWVGLIGEHAASALNHPSPWLFKLASSQNSRNWRRLRR